MPRIRIAGVIASTSLLALTLTGCSVANAFGPPIQSEIFDTAKDMKASGTSAFGSPGFVPDDATIIRVDYDRQNGTAILTYTSPTLLKPDVCTKKVPVPKPAIQDSWWPVDGLPPEASGCPGGWSAFAIGQQVWAAKAATK